MLRNLLNQTRFYSSKPIGAIEKMIVDKIESKFSDSVYKKVYNTSSRHSRGTETHFEVVLVSEMFENKSILERNKLLNELLKDEIKMIHSISFKLLPLSKWKENDKKPTINNPPCINKKKQL